MGVTSDALYQDRSDAGRRLAARLERLRHEAPFVLAIPRGGVPVAIEVARSLGAPLDVIVVRKVGEPGRRVGAVAEGGLAVIDHEKALELGLTAGALAALREQARIAAEANARRFRAGAAPRDIVGRTVLIVDDGIGSGGSAIAAAHTARHRGAARVVLAVPVASAAPLTRLGEEVDEIVCIEVAPLARWYLRAPVLSDAEIATALRPAPAPPGLHLPEGARGAVVLAGGGALVRRTLDDMGFATMQLDPDVDAAAIAATVRWLQRLPATHGLALGCFGLGATAVPTLAAAADGAVAAVGSAGGRPDAAQGTLARLTAPTLLIAGGEDRSGLRGARRALERLAGEHELAVVAGATHGFGEPGALEQVAHLAGGWFARHA